MYERAKTFTLERPRLKKSVGWVFIIVGGVALVVPMIPGAPLVFVGLELIGIRLLFIDKLFRKKQSEPVTASETGTL